MLEDFNYDGFEAANPDISDLTDSVMEYISLCEDMCVQTKTFSRFNNSKPWFTPHLYQQRREKVDAFKSGDQERYRRARNVFNRHVETAKKDYGARLNQRLSGKMEPTQIWSSLRTATGYKPPRRRPEGGAELASELNKFYTRFETTPDQRPGDNDPHRIPGIPGQATPASYCPPTCPHPNPAHLTLPPLAHCSSPPSPTLLQVKETEVCQLLRRQNTRKAPGPDKISPACLKFCAVQLAPILTWLFNLSLQRREVPRCFKRSTIIPVPKSTTVSGLNDYRPVALTSVVMKVFEKLVLRHLKATTGTLLDPLQFAYRANRSVDDAVNIGLHQILRHVEAPGTYARVLFIDFSSAFNTIAPDILGEKLTRLSVPAPTRQWIDSFLTGRSQQVRLGHVTSPPLTTNVGAPQGCVLSPALFTLYTNDCTTRDPTVKLLKYADDTTVIGLIRDGDESAYRKEVDQLVQWCGRNRLLLNPKKTVEMVVDFRKKPPQLPPLTILGSTVATTDSYKFLGTTISNDLRWTPHIDILRKKALKRLYFLRQLRRFGLPRDLMVTFYTAIIQSVLCSSITVWFGSATKLDRLRLQRVVRTAEKIIGTSLPAIQDLAHDRLRKRAGSIVEDPSHPAHHLFTPLPSGRRYRALPSRTKRLMDSFFPQAVRLLNSSR